MIDRLAIAGYRSLRDVVIDLSPLTVVTGPNGSGKSSLYRALRLLADVAQGRIVAALAGEGGLASTLWAGPESFGRDVKAGRHPVQGIGRRGPVALRLGYAGADYGYAIDLGLPVPSASRFASDPEIKVESVWIGETLSPRTLIAERRATAARMRDAGTGAWRDGIGGLSSLDSIMTHRADVGDGLELLRLREAMRGWRFYDDLRTDRTAPARQMQVGTYTPVLAGDGADLGAAIQTIREIGDVAALDATIADAFDGATIGVGEGFVVEMRQHGLLRSLAAAELSDGTLRYLLLAAALLSPRPPRLMVLNEPEASLHPDLLAPLARLIGAAAAHCQIVIVTHAATLVAALRAGGGDVIALEKVLGETHVVDRDRPRWAWPKR